MSANGKESAVALVIKLSGVQKQIDALKAERDDMIRGLRGHVSGAELARFTGLSPAQVSRIQTGAQPKVKA